MRTYLISCCFFLAFYFSNATTLKKPFVIVKLSSTDCNSCMLSLEKLNRLNQKVELYFVLRHNGYDDTIDKSIPAIIKRNYEVVLSDSLYDSLKLTRTSYYLFGENDLLDYGHINEFDPIKVKLLSTPYLTFKIDTLARCDAGFNDLQLIDNSEFIIHNLGLNTIVYYNINLKQGKIWNGQEFTRLDIYKALNNGDSLYYWKNVMRHKEMLTKYNMFHLKFESVSRLDSNLYVFATINNVEDIYIDGNLKRVISPELLICQISLSNKQDIHFIHVDELPKSRLKRYSIDNTQKIFPISSSELMIPIYSDVPGKKNKIFAHYKKKQGTFQFDDLLEYELPKSFIQDNLFYEGNYYQIEDGLLVFIASGDYIQLETGNHGNFNLGKTVLSKIHNEYQTTIDWRVEGIELLGNLIYLYFVESKIRKMAVFDINKKEKTIVYNTPLRFCNLKLSSNFIVAENGDFYFVSEEGLLLKI